MFLAENGAVKLEKAIKKAGACGQLRGGRDLTDASNACLRTPTHNPSFLDLSRSLLHRYCNRIEEAVSACAALRCALQCLSAVNAPANRTFKVISRPERSGIFVAIQMCGTRADRQRDTESRTGRAGLGIPTVGNVGQQTWTARKW